MLNNEHSSVDLLTKPVKTLEDFTPFAIFQTFTYQTRLLNNEENFASLEEYASLYGKIERSLFEDLKRHDLNSVKQLDLASFGITARQFNAIRISLEGKIESATQSLMANITRLQEKIATLRNWAKITATFQIKYKALSYSSILGEIHLRECLKR